MSEAPEGIWVFQNGLWSRDYENYHPEPTEYIRKDVSDALIAAAYVDAANLHQSLWRETSAYKTDQILKRTSTDTRQALDALLKAEREKALREAMVVADAAMKKYAAATYSKEPVKVFNAGDDQPSQSAAKCYCAGEIYQEIEALIEKDQ